MKNRYGIYLLTFLIVSVLLVAFLFSESLSQAIYSNGFMAAALYSDDRAHRIGVIDGFVDRFGIEAAVTAITNYRYNGLLGRGHDIGHILGEIIYKKLGLAGFSRCGDSGSSGCVHGFTILAITEHGLDVISPMIEECLRENDNELDEGFRCTHSMGHGLLAYNNYEHLPDVLAMCDNLSPNISKRHKEYCYYGVFMENTWGDHNGREPFRHPWLSRDDMDYPCNAVDERYQSMCYYNQSSWWHRNLDKFDGIAGVYKHCGEDFKGEVRDMCLEGAGVVTYSIGGKPKNSQDFEIACQNITSNEEYIDKCITGFAVTQIPMSGSDRVPISYCNQTKTEEGARYCERRILENISATNDKERVSLACGQLRYAKETLFCE